MAFLRKCLGEEHAARAGMGRGKQQLGSRLIQKGKIPRGGHGIQKWLLCIRCICFMHYPVRAAEFTDLNTCLFPFSPAQARELDFTAK